VDSKDEDWTIQKITYSAPYGHEQAISYLLLAQEGQAAISGRAVLPWVRRSEPAHFAVQTSASLDAWFRSGRAVLYPVYKSTYERGDGMSRIRPTLAVNWRDHVVMWARMPHARLTTRKPGRLGPHEKIAYYGYSWGAVMGAIVPALTSGLRPSSSPSVV